MKINGTFGETITLVIDGDTTADRLTLGDDTRRLATVQRAEVIGFRYQYPTSIRIRQVTLRKPWLLLERNTDGSFGAHLALRVPDATRRAVAGRWQPAAARGTGPRADRIAHAGGRLRALRGSHGPIPTSPRSYPPCRSPPRGSARDRVAERQGGASRDVRLRHPLSIRGEVGGFTGPHFLDLTVEITDYPVPRLNPYMDHLLAWVAKDGTLTAALHYRLAGDELQADNGVTLRALDLERAGAGGVVQQRVGLPLDTLVSVLKDRSGDIHVNVPVGGSLSAPEFHYGEAVWGPSVTWRSVSSPCPSA